MLPILNEHNGERDCDCGAGCGCNPRGDSAELSEAEFLKSRRQFMQKATTIALGAMSLTVLPVTSTHSADENGGDGAEGAESGPTYGFLVDTDKCVGIGKCLTACRIENNVPEGHTRTWVERYVHFKDGRVQVDRVPETGYSGSDVAAIDPETVSRSYFVPKLCNQCTDAPCNQVCPTHASITSPGGIELVDPELCIGCAYCVQACPYGIRFINHETENADKCTWCYHRVNREETPACVEACPTGARIFGRIDDPNSEISKRIAAVPTSVLKQHLGTHPKLRYTALDGEVI